ncbi:MAG: ATP-dependent Clp protease proteolytic subunit [Candidatus Hydrogenedentes bacterium]|nr:ATP-dependent Clp protease proteolytic subunit [Candidatus Hydrogenedentota bacterium]
MPCPEEEEEKMERGTGIITAKLLKSRTILINGPIDENLGEHVITQALVLDSDSHDPIRVLVTTPGGMVDVGFAIYDILRYVQSKIICIGAGFVASMGVPILLAAGREDRYTLPNTRFMMHQPSTGAAGVASDIRITAQEILKIRERLNKLISDETGQAIDKVAVDSDRDFWMSAEEAVEYGLVSKIVNNAREIG